MKIRHLFMLVMAVFLPVAVAACGADSTGDLSKDDISKELQDSGMPKAQADCIANKVKDADLTKEELDDFNKSPDTESKAGKALMSAVTGCMTTTS